MLLRNPDEIEAKLEFLISNGLDIEDAGLATKSFCKKHGIDEDVLKRKDVIKATKGLKLTEIESAGRELSMDKELEAEIYEDR